MASKLLAMKRPLLLYVQLASILSSMHSICCWALTACITSRCSNFAKAEHLFKLCNCKYDVIEAEHMNALAQSCRICSEEVCCNGAERIHNCSLSLRSTQASHQARENDNHQASKRKTHCLETQCSLKAKLCDKGLLVCFATGAWAAAHRVCWCSV